MRKIRKHIEKVKYEVLTRDDFTCVYCGNPGGVVDHVLPWDWNSNDSEDNLVCACDDCNAIANDKVFSSFAEKREYILGVRSTLRWRRKLAARKSICVTCKQPFEPRKNGSSLFQCQNCY